MDIKQLQEELKKEEEQGQEAVEKWQAEHQQRKLALQELRERYQAEQDGLAAWVQDVEKQLAFRNGKIQQLRDLIAGIEEAKPDKKS